MPEAVARARRDHDETRVDAGEEVHGAAPVGAVVRRHEDGRSRFRVRCEERLLALGLEIARQKYRCSLGRCRAEHEASIVERTGSVGEAGMKHRQLEAGAAEDLPSLKRSHGDAPRDGGGGDQAGERVALGSGGDPELPHVHVAEHRASAARVIVVIVRQSQDFQAAAAGCCERGNNDAIPGVEPSARRRAGIDQDGAAVGAANDDRQPLSDVEGLGACRPASGRRRAQMQGDGEEREHEADRASADATPPVAPQPPGEEEHDITRDEYRRRLGHPQMSARNGNRGARCDEERPHGDGRGPTGDVSHDRNGGQRDCGGARCEARRAQERRREVGHESGGGQTTEQRGHQGRGGQVGSRGCRHRSRQHGRRAPVGRRCRTDSQESRSGEHAQQEPRVVRERRDRDDQQPGGERQGCERLDIARASRLASSPTAMLAQARHTEAP